MIVTTTAMFLIIDPLRLKILYIASQSVYIGEGKALKKSEIIISLIQMSVKTFWHARLLLRANIWPSETSVPLIAFSKT